MPERPATPLSDTELLEREEKEIPKFAPSIRCKPSTAKIEEVEEEEESDDEENIDEATLAAMKIISSM